MTSHVLQQIYLPRETAAHGARQGLLLQYTLAIVLPLIMVGLCWRIQAFTGYMFVGMAFLLAVVIAAVRLRRGPVMVMATLSVLLWDYFFIPPSFTLRIEKVDDMLVCLMVYVIALCVLAALLRHREVAERRRQQAEVAAASERLRHTLLDSVSHELKTPLAALQAATDGLARHPEHTTRILPELNASLRRMRRTVGNLLDMTRIESGAIRPVIDWCDVSELCEAARDLTADVMGGRPFDCEFPADLPSIALDQALIEQALANLLLNAAVHTPPECPVTLRAHLEDSILTLSVLDRGPGLPPGPTEALFQKFSRGQHAPCGGSGLGLSIARGFARALGGEAFARPREGGGAEFSLVLPVHTLDDNLPQITSPSGASH